MTGDMTRPCPPSTALRLVLAAEVVGYVAALTLYVQLRLQRHGAVRWYDVVFYVLAGAFPVAMNLLHGDRPRDSGIRVDNLRPAAWEAAVATAAMAAGIVAVGMLKGSFHWTSWSHFASRAGMYAAWGPIQQYLLQAFGLRRLRQAGLPAWVAVVLVAGLFACVHAPNWWLVALAAGGGLVWCTLFSRRPSLIALGVAHGVLAVLLYYAWPEQWLHRLAIGAMVQR